MRQTFGVILTAAAIVVGLWLFWQGEIVTYESAIDSEGMIAAESMGIKVSLLWPLILLAVAAAGIVMLVVPGRTKRELA